MSKFEVLLPQKKIYAVKCFIQAPFCFKGKIVFSIFTILSFYCFGVFYFFKF